MWQRRSLRILNWRMNEKRVLLPVVQSISIRLYWIFPRCVISHDRFYKLVKNSRRLVEFRENNRLIFSELDFDFHFIRLNMSPRTDFQILLKDEPEESAGSGRSVKLYFDYFCFNFFFFFSWMRQREQTRVIIDDVAWRRSPRWRAGERDGGATGGFPENSFA